MPTVQFGYPLTIKGTTNSSDTEAEYSFKDGDFAFAMGATVVERSDGTPGSVTVFLIMSPTLAAAPNSDGSYEEVGNGSIIFGNDKVYFKDGNLGAIDGTWKGATLS